MSDTLGIDPGKRHVGVGHFRWKELIHASLVTNPSQADDDLVLCAEMARAVCSAYIRRIDCPCTIVAERPRIYSASKQRGKDPNDLPPLFGVDVGIAVLLGERCVSYEPRPWKGTISKKAMGERILERLLPAERARIVDAGALTHNIIDGIGIGLKFLGRLERRRAYA